MKPVSSNDLHSTESSNTPRSQSTPLQGLPALSLSAFRLEQATFEIRFPTALQLWDRAGAVWQAIEKKIPDIVLAHAEPARTVFRAANSTLTIDLESARITTTAPERSLEDFSKQARDFVATVVQSLGITIFKRIGFRPVYFRDYVSRDAAATGFFSLRLLRVPEDKCFEISDHPVNPQYAVRWESDSKGVYVQVRAETRKLDFDPPPEVIGHIEAVHKEMHGVTLDLDYYTVAAALPGQFDAVEWLRHAMHLVNRDTRYIFGD